MHYVLTTNNENQILLCAMHASMWHDGQICHEKYQAGTSAIMMDGGAAVIGHNLSATLRWCGSFLLYRNALGVSQQAIWRHDQKCTTFCITYNITVHIAIAWYKQRFKNPNASLPLARRLYCIKWNNWAVLQPKMQMYSVILFCRQPYFVKHKTNSLIPSTTIKCHKATAPSL